MGTDRDADDIFRLLSDEIRLDILRAVAIAQHEVLETGITALSFSDIYERVDVENTSKLSYHLGELTGTFLRKHEGGYAFTHAGEQLVRFVLAENYQSPSAFGPIETDGNCLYCGESALEATMHEQYFFIECQACERPAFSYRVRPAQVRSYSGQDLLESVIWEQTGDFLKMCQGVCPDCGGRMETEVIDTRNVPVPEAVSASFGTKSECRECLRFLSLPLPYAAAYHPESISFLWEHGIDVLGTGVWELHRHLQDDQWDSERIDADDATYRVEFRSATASLRVSLDETATVVRTERVRRREQRDRRR
jgi:hypothetical protein